MLSRIDNTQCLLQRTIVFVMARENEHTFLEGISCCGCNSCKSSRSYGLLPGLRYNAKGG